MVGNDGELVCSEDGFGVRSPRFSATLTVSIPPAGALSPGSMDKVSVGFAEEDGAEAIAAKLEGDGGCCAVSNDNDTTSTSPCDIWDTVAIS